MTPGSYEQLNKDKMIHGGDVYSLNVDLDLSVSINPYAEMLWTEVFKDGGSKALNPIYEASQKGLRMAVQYPDLSCSALRDEISKMENAEKESVICGNGASELFMAIVHAVKPKKALVLSPCYSGYEHALFAVDAEVESYELKESLGFALDDDILDALTEDTDIFFLANPNNPTGLLVESGLLRNIIKTCIKNKILLVLDICFYALSSDEPLQDDLWSEAESEEYILVVNALTKTMAMPGLRFGYMICRSNSLASAIQAQLPEWNISTVAQESAKAAAGLMKDTDIMERSRELIRTERSFLTEKLTELGFTVFKSDANYILFKADAGLYEKLLEQKILVRDCSSFSGLGAEYIRVAVKTREEDMKFIEVLGSIS